VCFPAAESDAGVTETNGNRIFTEEPKMQHFNRSAFDKSHFQKAALKFDGIDAAISGDVVCGDA